MWSPGSPQALTDTRHDTAGSDHGRLQPTGSTSVYSLVRPPRSVGTGFSVRVPPTSGHDSSNHNIPSTVEHTPSGSSPTGPPRGVPAGPKLTAWPSPTPTRSQLKQVLMTAHVPQAQRIAAPPGRAQSPRRQVRPPAPHSKSRILRHSAPGYSSLVRLVVWGASGAMPSTPTHGSDLSCTSWLLLPGAPPTECGHGRCHPQPRAPHSRHPRRECP